MLAYVLDELVQTRASDQGVAYVVTDNLVQILFRGAAPAPPVPPIPPVPPAPPPGPTGGGGGVSIYPSVIYGDEEPRDLSQDDPLEPDAPAKAAYMLAERMDPRRFSSVSIRLAWRMRKPRP